MSSTLLLVAVFGSLLLVAGAFVAWPLLRTQALPGHLRALVGAIACLLVLGIGGGTYLYVGAPELAQRAVASTDTVGLAGLVAKLSVRMREHPGAAAGWMLLGRGYLSLNDPVQAAEAFRRAAAVAPPSRRAAALSAEGEALFLSGGGVVTPDAEQAFSEALSLDPKDRAARFYLGEAYAARQDRSRALAMWQSLLADTPPAAPWRANLVDRIAALTAQSGGAPDVHAMVAGLAARLKAHPDDLDGWQRLIRAYAVLGARNDARDALKTARAAMQANPAATAALAQEAQMLKLQE